MSLFVRPIASRLVAVAGLLAITCGAGHASITNGFTFGVTEGNNDNRKTVAGTTDLDVDASPGSPGIDLGTLGAGDIIGVYGRIVGSIDTFFFDFTTTGAFEVLFDFDGYDLENGDTVDAGQSGFIDQADVGSFTGTEPGGKGTRFSLWKDGGEIAFYDATSNYTSLTAGSDPFLFGASMAGTYTLVVDGTVGPKTGRAALYDLNIAAVPLPFAGIMLLTGLGGVAVAYRRRKPA